MSPITRACFAPRVTAGGVMEHVRHRDGDLVLVAEHRPAQRVADEDQRDAGLVDELGRRVVVGGQHRDALAVGMHQGDVADRQAANGVGLDVALMQGLLGHGASLRGARRERPARLPPDRGSRRRRPASPAAAGRRASRRRRGSTTRFVSVPKPEPGSDDVVGDEVVDALAAELVGRPVQRAGLGGEPDEDRTAAAVACRRARRRPMPRMSSVGSSSRVRPLVAGELRRGRAAAAGSRRRRRP